MLNPHLKLPDCYKTQIKLNIGKFCSFSQKKSQFAQDEICYYFKKTYNISAC